MQIIAETLSQVGGMGYLTLVLGFKALGLSIAAMIIASVSKRRKFGVIFGTIAAGLSVGAIFAGAAGMGMGMTQVTEALSAVPPEQTLALRLTGRGIALSALGLGLLAGGPPLSLSLLAIIKAFTKPISAPTKEALAEQKEMPRPGSKGAAVTAAVVPGAQLILGIGLLLLAGDSRALIEEGGAWLVVVFLSALLVTPLICVLGYKAARGADVPAAAFLILALQPWLIALTAQVWVAVNVFGAFDAVAPDMRAAVLARGMSEWLNIQTWGPYFSALLLTGLAIGLAVGAAGMRGDRSLPGRWVLGIIGGAILLGTSIPISPMEVGGAVTLWFGAAVISVVLGLGFIKIHPKRQSIGLGIGAALAAGVGVLALFQTAAATVSGKIFSALAVVAASDRADMLLAGVADAGGIFAMSGPLGWIALLPAAACAVWVAAKAPPGRTGIIQAVSAVVAISGLLGFNAVVPRLASVPDSLPTYTPWQQLAGYTPMKMKLSGDCKPVHPSEIDWFIGKDQMLVDGRMVPGGPGDPKADAQLEDELKRLKTIGARIGQDTSSIHVAMDENSPSARVRSLIATARRFDIRSLHFVGSSGIPKMDLSATSNAIPFSGILAAMSDDTCSLTVRVADNAPSNTPVPDAARPSTQPQTAGALVRSIAVRDGYF